MQAEWRIYHAETEEALARCYAVMAQLRPHLTQEDFVAQVGRQVGGGYRLAVLEDGGTVSALAGYRFYEMLAHGKVLYVDDLVTDGAARSQGYGAALMNWLLEQARAAGCAKLQLDSGVQRFRAHRFYFVQGMHISSYRFSMDV